MFAPSRKSTVPVGVTAEALVTVAVKVTGWPAVAGFNEEVTVVLVGAMVTLCVSAAEVLAAKLASPLYVALIVCTPAIRSGMENVACPALSVPVPIAAAPSKNVTVPVGVPGELSVTVAVKVTVWPAVAGFSEEVTAVLVGTPTTVCVKTAEVLASNVASPWYAAVIEWEPTASAEVDSVAWPALSVAVPIVVVPSRNATVPVGVPTPVTVAVKVTDCPAVEGFGKELTVVVVGWPTTVCVSAADVLPENVASPEYLAEIVCEPAVSAEVDSVACPAVRGLVPIAVVPSKNATVPVGDPARLVTVAVKVTDCPAFEGFKDEVTTVLVDAPVAASSKRYAAIAPVRGLLPEPVMVEVASWPSVAKA